MKTEKEQRKEKVELFIRRIKEGKTVKMSGRDYDYMCEVVQVSDEDTYKAFGKMASTLDKSLSIGTIQVYDVYLKQ